MDEIEVEVVGIAGAGGTERGPQLALRPKDLPQAWLFKDQFEGDEVKTKGYPMAPYKAKVRVTDRLAREIGWLPKEELAGPVDPIDVAAPGPDPDGSLLEQPE